MSWWRRWWSRRALRYLLPNFQYDDSYKVLFLAIPVPNEMLEVAADSFFERGKVANYVGQIAFNKATTAVREALPFKLPHADRRLFSRESWSG